MANAQKWPSRAAVVAASCARRPAGETTAGRPHALGIALHQLVDDGDGRLCDRALEIGEQFQHHWSARGPAAHHVVGDLGESAQAEAIADDQFLELRERPGSRIHFAVDGVRRRAVHAELVAFGDVGLDHLLRLLALYVLLKACDVEAQLLRVADQVVLLDVLLVREEQVVHLPELPLRFRRHRRLIGGCAFGWMDSGKFLNCTVVFTPSMPFACSSLIGCANCWQNGHWKSEYRTISTGGIAAPSSGVTGAAATTWAARANAIKMKVISCFLRVRTGSVRLQPDPCCLRACSLEATRA